MNKERIYSVLHGPHMSEKTALRADMENQVVFKVAGDAYKREVKKAVEAIFSVKVDKVQIVKIKGKVKRNRFGYAKRPSVKKAYVRLAEGHEIDFAVAE